MYQVTTVIKVLCTTADLAQAMKVAETAAQTFHYVEVKQVLTVSPWYAKSVKIFRR